MRIIEIEDLNEDVFEGKFLDIPVIIYFKNGTILKASIEEYTHDEDPFKNYIIIDKYIYGFDEVEKIEIV